MNIESVQFDLTVSRELMHHHAASILSEYPFVRDAIAQSVERRVLLQTTQRTSRGREYPGIKADSLNGALKDSFEETGRWHFEVTVQDGVIFGSTDRNSRIEGFDFGSFDARANLARLWSVCFGRRAVSDGESLWTRYLDSRPSLHALAEAIRNSGQPGIDFEVAPQAPTVLGEIQFGNWALAHRDVMKILAASVDTHVDLFVYVAADGSLASAISQGTVNFNKMSEILRDFSAVISVPTWLVGIDIRRDSSTSAQPLGMS